MHGTLNVATQSEALRRLKEMGLFPMRVAVSQRQRATRAVAGAKRLVRVKSFSLPQLGSGVKPAAVAIFTRQLATLVDADLPLFSGLRLLAQQESNRRFKGIISDLARHHAPVVAMTVLALVAGFAVALRTRWGRWAFDRLKLNLPVLGGVLSKAAMSPEGQHFDGTTSRPLRASPNFTEFGGVRILGQYGVRSSASARKEAIARE